MYLFIESQDPLEDRGAEEYLGWALELAKQKERVAVFFVENGVLALREGAGFSLREALREAGARLCADELALKERGLSPNRLAGGIQVAAIEQIVDWLADPKTKAIWH